MSYASVFGSVTRGEARADSDVDVLVELDQDHAMGIFEYASRWMNISAGWCGWRDAFDV